MIHLLRSRSFRIGFQIVCLLLFVLHGHLRAQDSIMFISGFADIQPIEVEKFCQLELMDMATNKILGKIPIPPLQLFTFSINQNDYSENLLPAVRIVSSNVPSHYSLVENLSNPQFLGSSLDAPALISIHISAYFVKQESASPMLGTDNTASVHDIGTTLWNLLISTGMLFFFALLWVFRILIIGKMTRFPLLKNLNDY